ncbi:DUF1428 domain-containing protein [Qipengyuania nanhaisediminis]|uniref:DUF1428 domain-containing protein n=1 Tax=Qipengyuania nanhaisediminis TaxID=604088 RepID=UPI0038B32E6E
MAGVAAMYVMGAVLAVKADRENDYLEMAKWMNALFLEHGALEIAENWEDDVPDGEQTDFRRAVAAEKDEKIVFSWITWPDKATHDAAHAKIMADERMNDIPADMPFDGKRMIYGGFRTIYHASKGD